MNLILEMSPQLVPAWELLEGGAKLTSQASQRSRDRLSALLQLLFPRHVALTSPTQSRTLLPVQPCFLVNLNLEKKTYRAQTLAVPFPDSPPHFQKSEFKSQIPLQLAHPGVSLDDL